MAQRICVLCEAVLPFSWQFITLHFGYALGTDHYDRASVPTATGTFDGRPSETFMSAEIKC